MKKDGKRGYIDATGKLVVPCELDRVFGFYNGFAYVEKDGKYGYVDTTGKFVLPCDYDRVVYTNSHFFALKNGYLTIFDSQGKRVF